MQNKKETVRGKGQIKTFLSYYRPHIHLFLLDMVCATLVCGIDLGFPYLSRMAMQTWIPQSLFRTFFIVMAICLFAYVLKGLLY